MNEVHLCWCNGISAAGCEEGILHLKNIIKQSTDSPFMKIYDTVSII